MAFGLILHLLLLAQCNLPRTPSGKIVFVSDRDGNLEIYSMNADGTNQTRLTTDSASDLSPDWSPDGKWIVFQSDRDKDLEDLAYKHEIYIMDSEGNHIQRLTNNNSHDGNPKWSPSGDWIAYESYVNGYPDIYIMKPDGSQKTQLTFHPASDSNPSWFSDGEHVLFDSNRYKHPAVFGGQLFKININSLELTPVTEEGIPHMDPAISPNGKYITYSTLLHPRIYISEITTIGENIERVLIPYSSPIALIDIPSEMYPGWLPDSENIIFAWGKDGDSKIFMTNVHNLEFKQLTDNLHQDFAPDWWPIQNK